MSCTKLHDSYYFAKVASQESQQLPPFKASSFLSSALCLHHVQLIALNSMNSSEIQPISWKTLHEWSKRSESEKYHHNIWSLHDRHDRQQQIHIIPSHSQDSGSSNLSAYFSGQIMAQA
ncbi:predicted protein [Sclerotinia sclerotiorum 1980 UF-70]|uniref:Uncharacterized protein n=1 Tax=Sclerotinia sclerotiorum (strain ATCC 18683 / 1980 / Ss-1) TaxID=665079 RepID=A7EPQ0_SCLS1|nr:predicted protein [Sclerotinia sclerotiorum 1980 UF-70]EDO04816.1 predicted protein [Sclerotinia sclerotiorum 1980 UF-70]